MLKIGITGGIGSGKTLVSTMFKHFGVPVYSSDTQSKRLVNTNMQLREKLIAAFGEGIYNGIEINKEYFAGLIFKDKKLLEKANSIIHVYVRNDFNHWLQKQAGEKYIINEAAILFESGGYKLLDKIIVVYAPEELRISRVIQRDNATRESVEDRIRNQLGDNEKLGKADFVIYNDGQQMVLPQVLELHKQFME